MKYRFLQILAMVAGCLSCIRCVPGPQQSLQVPRVISFTEDADVASVVLSATFDHAENVTMAGFDVWPDGGEKVRYTAPLEGNVITCRCTGLEPETDYKAEVFWSNGREERVSDPLSFRTLPQPFDPVLWRHVLDHYDTNGDGEMSGAELSQVKEIVLSDLPLSSQAGLEKLTELENLYMGANGLKRIDLSANKKLQKFSCGRDSRWEELILDNPELIQLYFLGDCSLRTLDLTRCPMLYICEWWGVPLESVDFSKNLDLYVLRFSGSKLQELDLSANFRLRHLDSKDNPSLKRIWLKEGIQLESCEVESHTEIKYK